MDIKAVPILFCQYKQNCNEYTHTYTLHIFLYVYIYIRI